MIVSGIHSTSSNNFVPKPHDPGLVQEEQALKNDFDKKKFKLDLAVMSTSGLILTISCVAAVAITITAAALATTGGIAVPVFFAMCGGALLLSAGSAFIAAPIISVIGLYKFEKLDDSYKKTLEKLPEKLEDKTL
ncbi:MAG: hypothetical protein KDK62_05660 [Chlamydiia bacterium]|nr:hypothetical protein [Chlamydiia bacterium]